MRSLKFKILSSKKNFHFLLSLVCCLLIASCASSKVSKPAESGYLHVLDKWTRIGKIYDNFETKLLVTSTYKVQEFRDSYIDEYSKAYLLDSGKIEKLTEEESDAVKNYHEFFISVHTPIVEWSDLERKISVWAIYLTNDQGERVAPLEIKRVKDRVPGENRFYPYFDDWSKGYTVKFPLVHPDGKSLVTDKTKHIKLIVTGPPGKTELIWHLVQ